MVLSSTQNHRAVQALRRLGVKRGSRTAGCQMGNSTNENLKRTRMIRAVKTTAMIRLMMMVMKMKMNMKKTSVDTVSRA